MAAVTSREQWALCNGHVVQNPPCWKASSAPGHLKQRKLIDKLVWLKEQHHGDFAPRL